MRLAGCALSSAVKYRTPLYDLRVDNQGMMPFFDINLICLMKFYSGTIKSSIVKKDSFLYFKHIILMHAQWFKIL